MNSNILVVVLAILGGCYCVWWKFKELEQERHLLLGLLSGVLADHPQALEEYRQTLSRHELMGSSAEYKAGFDGSKSEMDRQIQAMRTAVSLAEYAHR